MNSVTEKYAAVFEDVTESDRKPSAKKMEYLQKYGWLAYFTDILVPHTKKTLETLWALNMEYVFFQMMKIRDEDNVNYYEIKEAEAKAKAASFKK